MLKLPCGWNSPGEAGDEAWSHILGLGAGPPREELRSPASLFRLLGVTFAKAAFLETDARLCLL